MRKGYILTEDAQAERNDFTSEYGNGGNCSCFTGCAPCASCTHPGNPHNQEEDDSCWVKSMKLEDVKVGQRVRLLPGSFDAGMVDLPAGSEGVVVSSGALVGVCWGEFTSGWSWSEGKGDGWSVEAEYLELLEDVK